MHDRHLITTPIYYVNDLPHIGHAYTTIAADILARHYRSARGENHVFFLTGTDEHGSKIAQSAAAAGEEPQAFADHVAGQFKETWRELGITYSHFIRTTDPGHTAAVQKILQKLKSTKTPAGNDAIYEGVYSGLYCVGCEKFLTQKELIDGKCPIHKTVPQVLEEKNWFFRLSDYLPLVKEKIESGEIAIHPTERKNETLGLFAQGIDDFSISRSSVTWGIPIPWDPEQRAYVWVDALSNYITALGYPDDTERVKQWWEEADSVQLMAVDILKFHAVYWPALLIALGLKVPDHLYVHGYFTIDGEKMSKSRGNVIKPLDLVRRYGADATRYLLLSQFSFGFESDVNAAEFDTKYNADLANGLGNLLSRVTNMIEKYFIDGFEIEYHADPIFYREVGEYVETLRFREALLLIWKKIAESNQRIDVEKPWSLAESDRERLRKILEHLARELFDIAHALRPFLPQTAHTIEKALRAKPIVKSTGLFARIEV